MAPISSASLRIPEYMNMKQASGLHITLSEDWTSKNTVLTGGSRYDKTAWSHNYPTRSF